MRDLFFATLVGRVEVYRNIRKDCYSIRDKKSGLVVEHTNGPLALENCILKVSKAGRERVLRERRKNIHAVIEGDILEVVPELEWTPLTYNPYKYESFVDRETQQPVLAAQYVLFTPEKAFYGGTSGQELGLRR